MSSERRSGSLARRLAAIAALASAALVVLVSAAPAPAGTPPNRLDDNRGNPAAQLAVNTLVTASAARRRSSSRSRSCSHRRSAR